MKKFRNVKLGKIEVEKPVPKASPFLVAGASLLLVGGIAKAADQKPLKPSDSISAECGALAGSVIELSKKIHSMLRVDGEKGVRFKEGGFGVPKTARDVDRDKEGDCGDLTYYFLSCIMSSELNSMEDVKIGAMDVHLKESNSETRHIFPLILVKGEVPDEYSYDFKKDKKLREKVMKIFGIECTKGWNMILMDPQADFGVVRPFDDAYAWDVDGTRGVFFREIGMSDSKKNRVQRAVDAFERTLELNENDGFAHANLAELLHNSGRIGEALVHAEKAYELMPKNSEVRKNYVIGLNSAGIAKANEGVKAGNAGELENAMKCLKEAKKNFERLIEVAGNSRGLKQIVRKTKLALKQANGMIDQLHGMGVQ